ncbi:MAG: PQQ-dependent sugar dehydrogenase, partial [Phycisphaerae bacterium]
MAQALFAARVMPAVGGAVRVRARRAGSRLVLAIACGLVVASAAGDFDYADFNSTAGLALVNQATPVGGVLRLTPNTTGATGAAYYGVKQRVVDGFRTTFSFRISGLTGGGADGFAMVIQNAAFGAIGGSGCQNGYHGIANSVAVEFDTFANTTCEGGDVNDPSDNHISIHTLGTAPNSVNESASIGATTALPNLSDGAPRVVQVLYSNGELAVFLDDLETPVLTAPLDLASTLSLDNGGAWVGFTASTGGSAENHDILSWQFVESPDDPGGPHRPRTPTVTEPQPGRAVNPADLHMETDAFFDADGDLHRCTDWEVWAASPSERVWATLCIGGVERLHTHLGDGAFEGSHAGRSELFPDRDYVLRVRHRDDSDDAATEWSFYASRVFTTTSNRAVLPLALADVLARPRPLWRFDDNLRVVLPGGANPPALRLEAAHGGEFFTEIRGLDGVRNEVVDEPALPGVEEVRVRVLANGAALDLAPSTLRILASGCVAFTLYLPAIQLAPGGEAQFWVTEAGSSYRAQPSEEHPQFDELLQSNPSPWRLLDAGFAVERVATNFQLPVNIAFKPDAGPAPNDVYYYVTELYGTIKAVTRAGVVSDFATELLNFNPTGNFPGSGEQGLTGIVVNPANGDVFASLLYSSIPGQESAPHYPRVVRFTSNDGGRTAAMQTTVLDMPGETQGQSHQISNLTIGPDGKLYVHMGDGFSTSTAQNLSSYRGKILRVNLDGSAPTDNPFYNPSTINARDYVFAYGVRNPFGGAWRASDGRHYSVENGPSIDRFAQIVAGRNYGWNGSDASMTTFALYNWSPAVAPVNIAFIQPETFGGSGFPVERFDHAFVSESGPTWASGPQANGKRITEFVLDAAGNRLSGPTTLLEYAGTGNATVAALAAGPDGLYFSDLYKDQDYQTPIDRGANVF